MPAKPGQNQPVNPPIQLHRRDNIVPEAGQDAYRFIQGFADGTTCPTCGAIYARGRWQWPGAGTGGTKEALCPACMRIRDGFCAGELIVSGAFVREHRAAIDQIIESEARVETEEHPLNRVAQVIDEPDGFHLRTTDIHLARRLGEALHDAFGGELSLTYPPDDETVRVAWQRNESHPSEPSVPRPNIPIEVIGKGLEVTPELEKLVDERIARLHRFWERIMACRVTVEGQDAHHRHGGPYAVALRLEVPGDDIVVTRQSATDLRVAVRFAFEAAQRQLEDQVRRLQPEPAREDARQEGRIVRIRPGDDFGFLAATDGAEVYFHRNSVLGAEFESLFEGEAVRFVAEPGDKGLQASTVHVRRMNR